MSKMSQLNEEFWRGWHIGYQAAKDDNSAEPVKHGRWLTEKDEYDDIWCQCSECGYTNIGCEVFNLDGSKYCPNCGAKMGRWENEN